MKPKTEFSIQADILITKLPEKFSVDKTRTPFDELMEDFTKQTKEYVESCYDKSAQPKIIVDLSECQFIDSCGLGALIVVRRGITTNGGEMVLVELNSEKIVGLFNLTRMNRVFDIITMAEAMRRFQL